MVTCLDGYQMARKGRAGAALGISAIGSFIAGTFSVVGLMLIARPLADFGLRFGPAEYFLLMILALLTVGLIGGGSLPKSLAMAIFGVLVSTIGLDVVTGRERLTFGTLGLVEGVDFIIIVMGLFAISEVLSLFDPSEERTHSTTNACFWKCCPNREEMRRSVAPIARGTILGFFIGVLPGAGASIASFISYGIEKRFAKHPERFGQGEIEGVAGPEAANNAASGGALVPLLSLGIPGSGSAAIILGAMILSGVRPRSNAVRTTGANRVGASCQYVHRQCFAAHSSNLPMIPFLASLVRTPVHILLPIILVLSVIGVFNLHNNIFDLWLVLVIGIAGYFLSKAGYGPAPTVLGVILGPLLEQNLRQALKISHGSISIFVKSEISIGLLSLLVFCMVGRWVYARYQRSQSVQN